MKTTHALSRETALLAALLERLDQRGGADAGQYRDLAARLAVELTDVAHDAALEALLEASPAAAAIYENLNYQHAGLCRTPLDAALGAELLARDAIARAMQPAARGAAPGAA